MHRFILLPFQAVNSLWNRLLVSHVIAFIVNFIKCCCSTYHKQLHHQLLTLQVKWKYQYHYDSKLLGSTVYPNSHLHFNSVVCVGLNDGILLPVSKNYLVPINRSTLFFLILFGYTSSTHPTFLLTFSPSPPSNWYYLNMSNIELYIGSCPILHCVYFIENVTSSRLYLFDWFNFICRRPLDVVQKLVKEAAKRTEIQFQVGCSWIFSKTTCFAVLSIPELSIGRCRSNMKAAGFDS
jgi:hypothetical protein